MSELVSFSQNKRPGENGVEGASEVEQIRVETAGGFKDEGRDKTSRAE